MIAVHELALHRVRRFVSQDAHIVVGAAEAMREKNAVHADGALAETARLAIRSRLDVQTPVRRIEKSTQLARVILA